MNKVVILTDSTCDLSDKLVRENDIVKIPLYVSFDGEMYRDGFDIDSFKLYEMVKERKKLPKTSACSIGDFMEVFSKYLKEGYDVFYMGIGSKLSATFNNSLLAKELGFSSLSTEVEKGSKKAAELLVDIMENRGPQAPYKVLIEPILIER